MNPESICRLGPGLEGVGFVYLLIYTEEHAKGEVVESEPGHKRLPERYLQAELAGGEKP